MTRKKIHPMLKRNPINVKLSQWIIEKLRACDGSQGVEIEKALLKKNKWKAPKVDGADEQNG